MRSIHRRAVILRLAAAGLAVALTPLGAAAQETARDQPPAGQGPMVVQRIHNGFLASPDVKVTRVDGRTSALVGGYAGIVIAEAFFIGGGGYWLANNASDRRMAYGGALLQVFARTNRRIGFSAKGLLGAGEATLGETVTIVPGFGRGFEPGDSTFGRFDINQPPTPLPTTTRVRFRQDFFVAEPEADAFVRLGDHVRLVGGAGYRFVNTAWREGDRLRGATGTVGIQFVSGS